MSTHCSLYPDCGCSKVVGAFWGSNLPLEVIKERNRIGYINSSLNPARRAMENVSFLKLYQERQRKKKMWDKIYVNVNTNKK